MLYVKQGNWAWWALDISCKPGSLWSSSPTLSSVFNSASISLIFRLFLKRWQYVWISLKYCHTSLLSHVRLFVTPRTVAHQAPLVHGIFQARLLEYVAISYYRGSSRPRDRTHISYIGRQILYHHTTWLIWDHAYFVGLWRTYAARLKSAVSVHVNIGRSTLSKHEVNISYHFHLMISPKNRIISEKISTIRKYLLSHRNPPFSMYFFYFRNIIFKIFN